MFETIHALAAQAKITSLNINARLSGEQLTVIVSFLLPSMDHAVFDSEKSESQDFINLRAALATPIVITASAAEIESKVEQALRELTAPVVEASTTLAAIDLKALLSKTTAAAPKASAKAKKPAESAEPDADGADDADEQEAAVSVETAPATAAVATASDYSEFDSL